MNSVICPHCGQHHPVGAAFCPVSGRPIQSARPPRFPFLVLAVVGLVLLGGGVWLLAGEDPLPLPRPGTPVSQVFPVETGTAPPPLPTFVSVPTITPSPVPSPTMPPTAPAQTGTATASQPAISTHDAFPTPTGEIAYMSAAAPYQIFLITPDGSGRALLPNQPPNSAVPSFSPDGLALSFEARVNDRYEVFAVNLDGSNLRRLTTQGGYDSVWSPIDDRIVFTSYRDGNSELYMINADGTGERRLTYNTFYDDDAS